MSLDSRQRSVTKTHLQSGEWDLLVIGGGITGAGIALDAACRGLRVALVEMQDFAAGTSSRSTKLIHGGLRYLKQLDLKIVREVGHERAILHQNAGHIVVPEKMLLPIVRGGTFGRLGVRLGLWLYDRLAGVKPEERRVMLSVEQTRSAEPLLGTQGLQGAGLYSEYRTDDARLVIEVLKTACDKGAKMLNYARVDNLIYYNNRIAGAVVEDMVTKEKFEIKATYVVNAAGPWVDSIREKDKSLKNKRLHHTKGVHLVVARQQLPLQQSAYFDVGDGRMIFAIPRGQWTYFGTTDTNYNGKLDHPEVTAEDADYLIAAVNRMFPTAKLERSMIESSWAGIRPLIHEDGKGPSQMSRKDELFFSDSGMITIAGGKLTGFRKMASKVVDVVCKRIEKSTGKHPGPCTTQSVRLAGFEFQATQARDAFERGLVAKYAVPAEEVEWLYGLFGSNSEAILQLAGGSDRLPDLRGALRYCIRHEGAVHLGDFFVRRSAMLYFGRPWIAASLPTARAVFEEEFGKGYDPDPGLVFAKEYEMAVQFL